MSCGHVTGTNLHGILSHDKGITFSDFISNDDVMQKKKNNKNTFERKNK